MRGFNYIIGVLLIAGTSVMAAEKTPVDTVKSAPGISIETSVDRSEIYIGDLIKYTLSIIHDSNIVLTPPPIGANLGAFDVKDYQTDVETKLKDGRIKSESRFVLTTFTTGDYIIPPIPVEFKLPDGTVKYLISEPTPIRVKSLLAEGNDSADIRDIKGPIYFKMKATWPYYMAGIVVILAAAGYYWWWRRRKKLGPAEFIDTRKPWEIAFESLAVLQQKKYVEEGKFKQFYIELTEIIRAYFGRVYRMPVLDMTTDEFLGQIVEKEVDAELFNRLKKFLNHGDMVKFAKLIPEAEKAVADFDEVSAIVETVRQAEMAKPPVIAGMNESAGKSDV
ncbi:conserved exported hypothetical protein [Candidatus Zixiibacteriota bacterium]|nr:conserved exported hypothetical protein [candidate division Zixibacteria bacterium]